MRIKILTAFIIVLFSQCNSETKTEKKEGNEIQKDSTETTLEEKDYSPRALEGNSYASPFITEYNPNATGKIEFDFQNPENIKATIVFPDNSIEELNFDAKTLIPRISILAYANNYHQQLSVYLFEKQWHSTFVSAKNQLNNSITYYEVSNPPKGKFWYLNAVNSVNGKSNIIASYRFKLPEDIIEKYFEKLNNRKYSEYKNYFFEAPESQKIDYNSIRKMGKFYEGFAASLNNMEFEYDKYLEQSIFSLRKSPKKINEFYTEDFEFPEVTENGYDTIHFSKHSLKDLFASQTFSYKTTYSLAGGKDSLLEIQIDFVTKENTPTVRLVIGGLVFNQIPRLKSSDAINGMHLPIGFSNYNNPEITQEIYVLMGNTTGFWLDNTFGRNIDGVNVYFDKNSPYKFHVWLVGGDGTFPVGHYLTSLDQLKGK